jgi:hypothetical protein
MPNSPLGPRWWVTNEVSSMGQLLSPGQVALISKPLRLSTELWLAAGRMAAWQA